MLLAVPAVGVAQMTGSDRIAAQVPFAFVVRNHTLPLGECIIQRADMGGRVLAIRSPEGKVNIYATTSMDESKNVAAKYTLVFHKYGTRHFLAAVKVGNSRFVYSLTPSRLEEELRAQNAPVTEEILLASAK